MFVFQWTGVFWLQLAKLFGGVLFGGVTFGLQTRWLGSGALGVEGQNRILMHCVTGSSAARRCIRSLAGNLDDGRGYEMLDLPIPRRSFVSRRSVVVL